MSWNVYIRGYKNYLQIEKSLSNNTVDAYCRDIIKLNEFFNNDKLTKKINELSYQDFQNYISHLNKQKINARSQSRVISSIRSFFKFLILEKIVDENPSDLLENPQNRKKTS